LFRLESRYGADWPLLVRLYVALHAPHVGLQTPTRSLECIVHGEFDVRVPLIGSGGTVDIDLPPIGKRQVNIDFVEAAGAMVLAGRFEDNTTRRHSTKSALKLGDVPGDGGAHVLDGLHSLKIDLDRRFHEIPQPLSGI
jgi:hypothetical protein